jgi:ribonuclease T2
MLLAISGAAKHRKSGNGPSSGTNSPGDFDYYLFTLSWAPEFCATNPAGRNSAECDPNKHIGLVVHGLWPQFENGSWPENCVSTSPVASDTVDHMMPVMPSRSLIQHEWSKHGTCSGLSTRDYFAAIGKLYSGLQVPEDFKRPTQGAKAHPLDIELKFSNSNEAPEDAFRISCPQNEFSAVEICLTKSLKYQACPASLKECRAHQIEVRPVP